jgi:hypothetical protein
LNACPYRATSVPHVCPQIIEFYRGDNNSDAGGGHSSWQGQTPDSIYFNNTGAAIAA